MKKLIITLSIILGVTTGVSAQNVGQMWVGGSVGAKTSKVKDGDRLTNYNVLPEFGYMISENVGLGVNMGYFHKEYSDLFSAGKTKTDGFKINPFARVSFLKGERGGLFVDAGAGYAYGKNKTMDYKTHELEVGFRPGVAINVSDKIALTGKFGFLGYQYEKMDSRKTNSFGFDFDLSQVLLGINLVF